MIDHTNNNNSTKTTTTTTTNKQNTTKNKRPSHTNGSSTIRTDTNNTNTNNDAHEYDEQEEEDECEHDEISTSSSGSEYYYSSSSFDSGNDDDENDDDNNNNNNDDSSTTSTNNDDGDNNNDEKYVTRKKQQKQQQQPQEHYPSTNTTNPSIITRTLLNEASNTSTGFRYRRGSNNNNNNDGDNNNNNRGTILSDPLNSNNNMDFHSMNNNDDVETQHQQQHTTRTTTKRNHRSYNNTNNRTAYQQQQQHQNYYDDSDTSKRAATTKNNTTRKQRGRITKKKSGCCCCCWCDIIFVHCPVVYICQLVTSCCVPILPIQLRSVLSDYYQRPKNGHSITKNISSSSTSVRSTTDCSCCGVQQQQQQNSRRHRKHTATTICQKVSTVVLYTALVVWIVSIVVTKIVPYLLELSDPDNVVVYVSDPYRTIQERTRARISKNKGSINQLPQQQQQQQSQPNDIVDKPATGMWNLLTGRYHNKKKSRYGRHGKEQTNNNNNNNNNKEKLEPSCRPGADWQISYPINCNIIHEINIRSVYTDQQSSSRYIDSGLWRHVWSLDNPAIIISASNNSRSDDEDDEDTPHQFVLKMMKSEHEVNQRNFDRHRRDAIVMEQLTSSPYVVNGYGYCGNSVLTEQLAMTLQHITSPIILLVKYDDDKIRSANQMEYQQRINVASISRDTPEGRLQLSYQIVQSIVALHSIDGGPIVHADIQSKQFLIAPPPPLSSNHPTDTRRRRRKLPQIKINDFNRCRFMTVHNETHQHCPFRIATAPGKARSPEEYSYQNLTEKLDIYALANVLYEILTGKRAWYEYGTTETKNMILQGIKPNVPEELLRIHEGDSIDAELFQFMLQAYELNATQRSSASQLLIQMEQLAVKFNITLF